MNVVKLGERLTGHADANAEPSPLWWEGVETRRQPSPRDEGIVQLTNSTSAGGESRSEKKIRFPVREVSVQFRLGAP